MHLTLLSTMPENSAKKVTPRFLNFTEIKLKLGDLTQETDELSLVNHSDTSYLHCFTLLFTPAPSNRGGAAVKGSQGLIDYWLKILFQGM